MSGLDPGVPPGTRLLAEGAIDHAECVIWDPAAGELVAGGEDGQLYRVGLDGSHRVAAHIPGAFLLGLALDRDGAVVACDQTSGRLIRFPADGPPAAFGPALGTPNFPAFAPDGALYVTISGTHNGGDGGIVRVEPDGTAAPLPLTRPLAFANALLVDGDDLLVVESDGERVVRVPRAGGEPRVELELPGTVPDGIALDREGGLWVSCYQPNRIVRAADGGIEVVADDVRGWALPMPTGICFAGPDLDRLAVACLGGWFLALVPVGVRGLPPAALARPVAVEQAP